MADTDALQKELFAELKGRIQEADQTAPIRLEAHSSDSLASRLLAMLDSLLEGLSRLPQCGSPEFERTELRVRRTPFPDEGSTLKYTFTHSA